MAISGLIIKCSLSATCFSYVPEHARPIFHDCDMLFFWWLNFLFLYSHHVSTEEAADGCAIMTVELSTIVDLFLMSFPIMQTIIPIRSYPRESWRRSKPVLYNLCFQLQHSETLGP